MPVVDLHGMSLSALKYRLQQKNTIPSSTNIANRTADYLIKNTNESVDMKEGGRLD